MGYFGTPRVIPGSGRPVADLNNRDPHLWVHDKMSGDMLAAIPLPANAAGAPMTYLAEGKQYVVLPVGGGPIAEELIALALP
jgi:quinoprotein glucose dehydrogenase